jgi:hypothetical protein
VDPRIDTQGEKIDMKEIEILNRHMLQNQYIRTNVIPKQIQSRLVSTKTVDMSYTNLQQMREESLAAIVKYFHQSKEGNVSKDRLVLKGCNINDSLLHDLVAHLIKNSSLEISEIDLSLNQITEVGCAHLAAIFSTDKPIKAINLSRNCDIGNVGFKTLMRSLRKNTHLQMIDLSGC